MYFQKEHNETTECIHKDNSHLAFRKANREDIDSLVDICKKSLLWLVQWQVPKFLARKLWRNILSSNVAETWVCTSESQVIALVTLVSDISIYEGDNHLKTERNFRKFWFYLFCPKLFVQKIGRKIHSLITPSKKITSSEPKRYKPNSFTWIKMIAVAPHMRKKGIATELLKYCEKRTLQLGKKEMKLTVEPNNIAAHNLYRNFGFHCTCNKGHTVYYTKLLTNKEI
jgi:GNAT superfamily N-acetyltransferase